MAYEEAPASLGGGLVAPVLMVLGQEWQKDYFLPRIANAELDFGQGFSEPDAGSDLAGLKMRATRDGDDYVLNGQKIWSQYRTEWMHILARTDPDAPKHRGSAIPCCGSGTMEPVSRPFPARRSARSTTV